MQVKATIIKELIKRKTIITSELILTALEKWNPNESMKVKKINLTYAYIHADDKIMRDKLLFWNNTWLAFLLEEVKKEEQKIKIRLFLEKQTK